MVRTQIQTALMVARATAGAANFAWINELFEYDLTDGDPFV